MSRKTFCILFSVLAAIIIALAGMNIRLDSEKNWDVCYEMANQHITFNN